MFQYTKYGPYICIGVVLGILFILWAFCGGKEYDFVGLEPLNPDTCSSYTGSMYSWGNNSSIQEENVVDEQVEETNDFIDNSHEIIDNTPAVSVEFADTTDVCINERRLPDIDVTDTVCTTTKIVVPRHTTHNITASNVNKGKFKSKAKFTSRGERLCKETMEKIYGVPFKTVRPDWLKNPETGRNLEIDCYNDDLKIGVEYNGIQHYKWPNFTNQTYENFLGQIRRDDAKFNMCEKNGVYLIIVPYNVIHEKIPSYITSQLPEIIQKRLREEEILL